MESHVEEGPIKFHALLLALDKAAAERVRAEGCPRCGGRLYVSAFPRKVRGLSDESVEAGGYRERLSLCCGREGCRRRATPPSVRFCGRRVYAALAVLVLSLSGPLRADAMSAADVVARGDAPARSTRRRWLRFWRGGLLDDCWFVSLLAQLRAPVSLGSSPDSLLGAFAGCLGEQLLHLTRWLCPLTTRSVPPEMSRKAMAS